MAELSGKVYDWRMAKKAVTKRHNRVMRSVPLLIERDETGYYVIECPILSGCYAQGKTIAEAMENIQEVINLVCDEPTNREILENYTPRKVMFKTIRI